ncbi:MAG: flagellar hook-associated protein 3 [Gammaproteobacteria bacterium]|nr:flagellar hook-associated protein 3 [Gammaproteobacteria bacterium]
MRFSTNSDFQQSLSGLTTLRANLSLWQQQVSTGKRLLTAAEDPAASAQVLNLGERMSTLEQFTRNANLVGLRLTDQETALSAALTTLQRVRELVVQAKGALTSADRRYINAEIRQRRDELTSLANTRNASGEYLFAGGAVKTAPFSSNDGVVSYSGDQTRRALPIAEGRTLAEGFTGAEAFMAIRSGNGTFVTALGVTNTGTGRVVDDAVTDPTAYLGDGFRIVFTASNTFDVVNDTTGATLLSAQGFVAGQAISFNGSTLAITGEPVTGDTFSTHPSPNQPVFATLNGLIGALDTTATTGAQAAQLSFLMDRSLVNIDQALDKFTELRTSLGALQNTLESQLQANDDLKQHLTLVKGTLEDADPVEAISNVTRYSHALEAALAAFAKVQSLSLFNYLR